MHPKARVFLADDFIAVVDDVKYFFAHNLRVGGAMPRRRYVVPVRILANSTNCSKLTFSARTCEESPNLLKASVQLFGGPVL